MYRIELNLTDMDNIERLNIINMTLANLSDQEIIESNAFDYWFDDNVDLEDHQETFEDEEALSTYCNTLNGEALEEFFSANGYSFDENESTSRNIRIFAETEDVYIPLTEAELNDVKIESVQEFKDSEGFWSLQEDYDSMTNSLHILQNEPTAEEVQLITKYAPNVTVYGVEELGVYGLSLNGCGMDMSDLLSFAYFIIDETSPIKVSQVMSLGTDAENALNLCINNAEQGITTRLYELKEQFGITV